MSHLNMLKRLEIILIAARDSLWLGRVSRSSQRLSVLFLCVLIASPGAIHAKKSSQDDSAQWNDWKAIDGGFIGRKKVPPRMDLALDKRASKSVQPQLFNLMKKKATLLSKIKSAKTNRQDTLQQKVLEIDHQLRLLQQQASARTTVSKKGASRADVSNKGAWLYNNAEGLHSVELADLALAIGVNEKNLVKKLKGNKLALTNHGRPVSYYYDKKAKTVFYSAESYETIYTAENAYRVAFSKQNARPMKVAKGGKGKPGNPIANPLPMTYLDTLYFEEEPDMYFDIGATRAEQDIDYWFWDYLFGPFKDTISVNLQAPNPAATGTAQLRIKMRGWTDLYAGDDHHVVAELNGQLVGAAMTWNAYDQAILVADFDQNILAAGGDNTLLIRSLYVNDETPGEYLDNIELDYLRQPVAQNGQLWLHNTQGGEQLVSGFDSDDILLVEAPTGASILRKDVTVEQSGDGFSVSFTAKAGVDYIVAQRNKVAAPQMVEAEAEILSNPANMGDYLIIAPREFAGTAEALTRLREAKFSHVKTVWLDQIYAEYSGGRVDPFAIGRFMKNIAELWAVTPTHVVILGKGSLDHKNRMGYGESFVPPMLTVTYDLPPWTRASSDDRLLGADGDADFAIGRIPIVNDEEGIAYVEKLDRFELLSPDNRPQQALLVADNPDSAGQFDQNSDVLSDWMRDSLGFTDTTKAYHPDDAVRSALTDRATWDSHSYITYDGHGTVSQLGDFKENFITKSDSEALSNTQYPLFTALTCAAGESIFPGVRSVATAMVLNPTGGAIAAVAPSGLSLDSDAQYMGYIYAGTLFGSSKPTIGEALQRSKKLSAGEVHDFMTKIYSVVGDPAVSPR